MLNLEELFKKHEDEYGRFKYIKRPPSRRADVTAFIILDRLVPAYLGRDIISYAAHDEIFLDIEPDELAKVATEEDIISLIRCGVRYNASEESFEMFV